MFQHMGITISYCHETDLTILDCAHCYLAVKSWLTLKRAPYLVIIEVEIERMLLAVRGPDHAT